jgi:hypothetical protein
MLLACTPPAARTEASEARSEPASPTPDEADPAAPADEPAGDPAPGSAGPDVAQDPEWFSPTVIEHTRVLRQDRSSPHSDGSVSASLQLELPEGQTIQGCIDALKAKIQPSLESLGEPVEGAGGRIEYRGKGPGYGVSFLCGHGKDGKLNAFVGLHFD